MGAPEEKKQLAAAEDVFPAPDAPPGEGDDAGATGIDAAEDVFPAPPPPPSEGLRLAPGQETVSTGLEAGEGGIAGNSDLVAGLGNPLNIQKGMARVAGWLGLMDEEDQARLLQFIDEDIAARRARGNAYGGGQLISEIAGTVAAGPLVGGAVKGGGALLRGAASKLAPQAARAARAAGQVAAKIPTPIVAAGRQAAMRAAPAAQQVARAARYVAPSAETTEAALLGAGEAALSEYGQEGAEGNVGAAAAGGAALAPLLPMVGRAGEALLNRTPARELTQKAAAHAKRLAQDLKLAGGVAGDLPAPTVVAGETYDQAVERIPKRLRGLIAEADDQGESIVKHVAQSRKRLVDRERAPGSAGYQRRLARLKPQEMADVAEVMARRAAATKGPRATKPMDYARMAAGYPLRAAGKIPQSITRTAGALGGGRVGSAVGDHLPRGDQAEPLTPAAVTPSSIDYQTELQDRGKHLEEIRDDEHYQAFNKAIVSPVLQGHEGLANELDALLGSWDSGTAPDDDAIQSMSYRLSEVPGLDYAQIDPNRQEGEADEY